MALRDFIRTLLEPGTLYSPALGADNTAGLVSARTSKPASTTPGQTYGPAKPAGIYPQPQAAPAPAPAPVAAPSNKAASIPRATGGASTGAIAPAVPAGLNTLQAAQMSDAEALAAQQRAQAEQEASKYRSLADQRYNLYVDFVNKQRPQLEESKSAALNTLGTQISGVEGQAALGKQSLETQYGEALTNINETKAEQDARRAAGFAARGIGDSSYYGKAQMQADTAFLTNLTKLEQSKASQLFQIDNSLQQAQAEFQAAQTQINNQFLAAMQQIEYNINLSEYEKEVAYTQLDSELTTKQGQITAYLNDLKAQQAAIRYQAQYDAMNSAQAALGSTVSEANTALQQTAQQTIPSYSAPAVTQGLQGGVAASGLYGGTNVAQLQGGGSIDDLLNAGTGTLLQAAR